MSRRATVVVFSLVLAFIAGCGGAPIGPPATLNRAQFKALYDDTDNVTDVYYTGTDSQYHHFVMEHWTLKSDANNAVEGSLISSKAYQVPIDDVFIPGPFPVTTDKDKWRLMRP